MIEYSSDSVASPSIIYLSGRTFVISTYENELWIPIHIPQYLWWSKVSFTQVFSSLVQTKSPTTIEYDDHEFIFEGFSLFTHYKIEKAPICRVIRFNIEYTIHWIEAEMPEVSIPGWLKNPKWALFRSRWCPLPGSRT